MSSTVLKYGFLSGLVIALTMNLAVLAEHRCGTGTAMAIGYTLMILSFLVVFIGVKHFRDHSLGGRISFGKAFTTAFLMVLISSLCYVAAWEVLCHTLERNFAHDYAAGMIRRAEASGLQGPALQKQIDAAHQFEASYSNPVYRMSMTLLEPLPVGLIMALVTAGILRRASPSQAQELAS